MAQPKLVSNTEFKIEKGVPVPRGASGRNKFPFGQMEVGDSIVIPLASRAAAYSWANLHRPIRFTARIDGDTVRVWRTA
jgi:hypothetical protein